MVIDSFRQAMRDAGIEPPDHIIADGVIHKFSTNGNQSDDAGRYCFYDDEFPAGWFKDWRTGIEVKWCEKAAPGDLDKFQKVRKAIEKKRAEDGLYREAEGRKKAAETYDICHPIDNHPYLNKKGVKAYKGLREIGGKLVIPIRNADGKLQSLQYINGDKRYMKDGKIIGGYYSIGDPNGTLCIAEGYATGASIHEATGHAVAVAFDSNNLIHVSQAMRAKFPAMRIILCADDDHLNTVNVGLKKAQEAAKAISADVVVPVFGEDRPEGATDFNDLHALRGLDAVKEIFMDEAPAFNNLDWLTKFELTEKEADMIADPEWIYENLIIRGHVIDIPAPPNGGKTTILFHIACELAGQGDSVIYVNADTSGGDAKPMTYSARKAGVRFVTPDLKGKSTDELLMYLKEMAESEQRLDDLVIFIDTFKKFTDVISKGKTKEILKLFRRLSALGMTVVLLSHTNKYRDLDGNLIFEGVGDIRSDVDEMIYFEPSKNSDGTMTVTTLPDKVRGVFIPITFTIDTDRCVSQAAEVVDTHSINKLHMQISKDDPVIKLIDQAVTEGNHAQKDIINYVHDLGISAARILNVLKRYSHDMRREPNDAQGPDREPGLYWTYRNGVGKELRYYLTG